MKVLLLEDEPKVISLIKRGMEGEGLEFTVAMDGYTAVKMAGLNQYDLIILDVMVPGLSGLEVCKSIRDSDPNTPILILSALDSTQDIVNGLNSLADDYMVKPFNLAELRARMQSLIRRSNRGLAQQNVATIADLSVNFDTMEVTRGNKVVALTVTEFRLLEYLIRNKRKVLPRLDILENVWGSEFDMGTNVVDVYINYLRKKIDKDFSSRLIHTVVGVGYVMRVQ
ncbi:response regulator transcription factor [Pontibacter indicus]|uniref:DNA-binding response regulator, OmpR family, contains REC and winged-helix (WHTH) domain n=1 Tax=Pontibacter indicus TaxID=1317125 RepID=A0A1R3XTK7_9BACT|nr:response regulator transcription factor [Pontibacter indicus]SIT94372.1 DNA-binding response regulator, OmpR family, contains REC and winged-helix (wHTH) domain [Pontibacter indicus]